MKTGVDMEEPSSGHNVGRLEGLWVAVDPSLMVFQGAPYTVFDFSKENQAPDVENHYRVE